MNRFRVVLDACVMLPQTLNDLLLTLADAELYQPIWSADLLAEVERHLVATFGKTADQAARRVDRMREAFPFAEIGGYRDLIPTMRNDPKDRHVLAAAVRAGAALIVTANLKDFPASALEPYGIEVLHPDEFLLDQLDLDRAAVVAALDTVVTCNRIPPTSRVELLDSLSPLVPRFVAAVRDLDIPAAPAPGIVTDEPERPREAEPRRESDS